MDPTDLSDWANTNLPDLYNPGMYDSEEISDEVWENVELMMHETVLQFVDTDTNAEDSLHETADDWFREHHALACNALVATDTTAFQSKPQTSQHSADWYAQRRNRLTASEFSQILDGRRGALLRSKIEPVAVGAATDRAPTAPVAISQDDGEMIPTSWGHRFEPVVRNIFELEIAGLGTVCDSLGRFTHATIPWLSASPDGVVTAGDLAGRLVEIKAPKSRQPGVFVPEEYYVQMQIQMEVCDAEAVEFIEAQFQQCPASAAGEAATAAAIQKAAWKGRIQVHGHIESSETWRYSYSRPVEDLEDLDLETSTNTDPLLESSVWWLTGWFPRTVLRNRDWWATVGWPAAELFWAQVQSGRESWTGPAVAADTAWIGSSN